MRDLFEMNDKNSILTGIEAIKKNKLQEAEEIFTNLLIQNPLDPEINHFLGITFQLNNNLENALKYFQKATEINPNFQLHMVDLEGLYLNGIKVKIL